MSTINVLITDGMAANGLEILKAHPEFKVDLRKETPAAQVAELIGNYECIVIRSATTLTADLIKKATKMKLIVRAGAGVDNIDVKMATELKIPVMNTASANSLAAAEQTVALMFSMLRQIPQAAQSLRDGKWERDKFKGFEVTGKTLGLIGLGNIGRIVAEKAIGLGMKILAYDPMIKSLSQVPSLSKKDESITLVPKPEDLLPHVHVLSLHVPKTPETQNFVNAARLEKMRTGSFIINCARGGLVDENALIAALDSGKIAGAAFDVYEKEPPTFPQAIFHHPKVVCTPHLGASTFEAQERVASTAAEQMVLFFKKGERIGIVNRHL